MFKKLVFYDWKANEKIAVWYRFLCKEHKTMFIEGKSLIMLCFKLVLKLDVFWGKEMNFVGWAFHRTVANGSKH